MPHDEINLKIIEKLGKMREIDLRVSNTSESGQIAANNGQHIFKLTDNFKEFVISLLEFEIERREKHNLWYTNEYVSRIERYLRDESSSDKK